MLKYNTCTLQFGASQRVPVEIIATYLVTMVVIIWFNFLSMCEKMWGTSPLPLPFHPVFDFIITVISVSSWTKTYCSLEIKQLQVYQEIEQTQQVDICYSLPIIFNLFPIFVQVITLCSRFTFSWLKDVFFFILLMIN